ncbi:hypothetical protein Bbelb_152290 [Branchiostoma belcheri]|nr:hypothetical protein Bbelb_152290 [Branchiostoma belcheri]
MGKVWRRNGDCHGGVVHMVVLRRLLLASSGDSCLNLTTVDWTRPGDLKTQEEYQWGLLSEPDNSGLDQTSSGDSCLNLTTVDWTRPDDLKTQEEYQLTAVMILNPTRPDVRVLRNLVTGNFSPVHTSKSDDLKTVCTDDFLDDPKTGL